VQNISTLHNYQERIDELRSTERQGSNEYLYQVLLVGACILIAWYFLGEVILVVKPATVFSQTLYPLCLPWHDDRLCRLRDAGLFVDLR